MERKEKKKKRTVKAPFPLDFDESGDVDALNDLIDNDEFFEEIGDTLVRVSKTPGEPKVPRNIMDD